MFIIQVSKKRVSEQSHNICFPFCSVLFVNCSSDLYSYPELIDGITSMSMI